MMHEELYNLMVEKGYPSGFAAIVATELHTEFTAKRMMGYIKARDQLPLEEVADEMMAILTDRDRFIKKHITQNAQEAINEWYRRDVEEDSQEMKLLRITDYDDIDERMLMDIYAEGNLENTDYFFPDEKDKDVAVKKVEEGFLDFLKNKFYKMEEATYWILEEEGLWVSAARTCMAQPGIFYLEALETKPDERERGYGSLLLAGIIETLKQGGSFKLCDCVSKKNIASLKTHEKCGFQIVSEEGYDYLQGEADAH